MFINRSNSKKPCNGNAYVLIFAGSNPKTNANLNAILSLSLSLFLSLTHNTKPNPNSNLTTLDWTMYGRHPIECICDECLPIFASDVVPSFNIWETINVPSVVLPVDSCMTRVHAEVPPHVTCLP
jgi:hypothetical protein